MWVRGVSGKGVLGWQWQEFFWKNNALRPHSAWTSLDLGLYLCLSDSVISL